nr:MAG TPA: hypothetical protein [Caudoviricetes sp.]
MSILLLHNFIISPLFLYNTVSVFYIDTLTLLCYIVNMILKKIHLLAIIRANGGMIWISQQH